MKKKYDKSIVNPAEQVFMLESRNMDGRVPHSHEFIELVYISSGKGIHHINGKSYAVSTGDLFIVTTTDEHTLLPLSRDGDDFRWINCIFLPSFIHFDWSLFPTGNRYIGTEGIVMNDMFQSMIREFEQKERGYLDVIRHYLGIILIRMSRLFHDKEPHTDYFLRKRQLDLKRAIAYMERNYKEKITIDAVCGELAVSPSYIGKLFKAGKGSSPSAYLNRYRIEQSSRLLRETALPIHQIAQESGFNDPKFYYVCFKRYNGITPGEYRSKYWKPPLASKEGDEKG